ncbi:MAG: CerR family C-terminal domain-containing protein [Acidobacteriota bacterium]
MHPAKSDETKQRLLRAAADIFAEKGFEAATVREICKQAGANVALVSYHFGDKLELYTEVLRSLIHPPEVPPQLPSLPPNPEEALRHIVKAMLEKTLDQSNRASLGYRLMLHEFVHPSAATGRVVDVTIRPVYDLLRGIVGALLALPPNHDKTRLCVHSIIGQVIHYSRSGNVVAALWPKLKMTPPQRHMIAEHIAGVTLTYIRAISHRPK